MLVRVRESSALAQKDAGSYVSRCQQSWGEGGSGTICILGLWPLAADLDPTLALHGADRRFVVVREVRQKDFVTKNN